MWGEGVRSVPVFLGRVHSQTRDLRSLQSSVGSRVPVALIVAEDAVVQRAPASTKLCRGVQEHQTEGPLGAPVGPQRPHPPSLPLRSAITRVMEPVLNRKPLRETEGDAE